MAFSFPVIVGGTDVLLTKVNSFITAVNAYLNAIPGTNITAATIPQTALAKGKAWMAWSLLANAGQAGLITNSRANVDALTVPNVDGASNSSFRIVGWSFHSGLNITGADALAKAAGNQVLVKVAGSTVITVDLNDATLAHGTPLYTDISATPITITSGQVVSADFVFAAGGVYPAPHLVLYVSLNHVSI